jgi:hypothetical protein
MILRGRFEGRRANRQVGMHVLVLVPHRNERSNLKRLLAIVTAAVAAAIFSASGSATIHPLMVGWVCGNASGDPRGQTPGETHSDQSTFRALQATGVILGVDPTTGLPIFDFDNPAIKFSSFTVVPVETGTPSNPGAINCAKGILATTT